MTLKTKYALPLALLYFTVGLVGIMHHELWLDESHHWLISRDSVSLPDLIKNTRYEGHPILWNILLFWVTRFTIDPFWMQLLHIAISSAAAYLFLKKAPFPIVFKCLFIFGYFMVFEYNIISRNYILGILFLFLACAVLEKRHQKFILLTLFLALATNVHLMFATIAFAIFLTLLFENYKMKRLFDKPYVIGYCLFLAGLLLAAKQILPPGDTRFFEHVQDTPWSEKFTKGFISLFKGMATIPDFSSMHFWNSNVLVNISEPFAAFMGLFAYILPLLVFYKNRKTLLFVYIALIGTQVFFFFTQLGATRYDGMTYLILVIALWIENYFEVENSRLKDFLTRIHFTLLKKPLIYSILVIHFLSGIGAYAMDLRYPFTTAKETVDYLKTNELSNQEIITVTCDGTLFSSYLGKKVYFLCDGSYGSYCRWYQFCPTHISPDAIINMVSGYMKNHQYAVYVSYYPIGKNFSGQWETINQIFKIRFLKKTGESIVRKNSFYIYEVATNESK